MIPPWILYLRSEPTVFEQFLVWVGQEDNKALLAQGSALDWEAVLLARGKREAFQQIRKTVTQDLEEERVLQEYQQRSKGKQ